MSLAAYPEIASRSSSGALPVKPERRQRKLREILDATSTTVSLSDWAGLLDATGQHVPVVMPAKPAVPSHAEALQDIKHRSGLTWDQLAKLFGVTRRAVHNWMRGQTMTQEHEEALHRLREIVGLVDTGNTLLTRSALRDRSRGMAIVDLFASDNYEGALTVATGGVVSNSFAALHRASAGVSDDARQQRQELASPFDAAEITAPLSAPPQPGMKRSTRVGRRRADGVQ